jgi:beta-galactosidase
MLRIPRAVLGRLGWVLSLVAASAPASANDAMFPAQPAAASSMGWQGNYFVVKGKPTYLSSGSIHYARIPQELWRERIVEAKRGGLNTIQSYVFWNAQEPQQGVFDFADNLDLDTWLSTIEAVGMYATIRIGPYSCAEWLSGGIPQWLTAQSGMQVRNSYAPFMAAVDAEFEQLAPILVKHQINNGGGLILLQLENEHPSGSGTDDGGDAYLQHLRSEALALGLQVPMFYSGVNHSANPAGSTPFGNRTYPWYSTEFWTGWYTSFGNQNPSTLGGLSVDAWHVVAFGGGGANYYMYNGGTNLGYSGDTGVTSYDYSAEIGEEGQLYNAYFTTRAPNAFAHAFESLLTTSTDGSSLVSHVANGLKTYVRKSPANGIAVFLDNEGGSSIPTQVTLSNPALTFPAGNTQITVAASEVRPLVVSAPWTANATIAYLASNVLGKLTLGTTTYYVCYGRSGESGEIAVQYTNAPTAAPASPWTWDAATKLARASFTYPTGNTITELPLDSGDGSSATFVVVNTDLANLTWVTDQAIFVGATYVTEDLSIDVPPAGANVTIYSSAGKTEVAEPAATVPTAPPALGSWQWASAAAEAAPSYDDSTWASSPEPQPFGSYNFQNGYGWYRATFTAASAGNMSFSIPNVRQSAMAFVNGQQVQLSNSNSGSFTSVAGSNTIAILAWHEGLDKMYNFTGAPTDQSAGIWGSVTSGGSALASSWKFRGGLGGMVETSPVGRVTNWSTFLAGTWASSQATKNWPAFWMTTFASPLQSGAFVTVGLSTKGMSSGSAWVNGHNIGRFSGQTLLYVPECWLTANNTLVIYDVSGNSPAGVELQYIETRLRYPSPGGIEGADGGVGGAGGADAGSTAAGGASGAVGTGGSGGNRASDAGAGGTRVTGGATGSGGGAEGGSALSSSVPGGTGGRAGTGGGGNGTASGGMTGMGGTRSSASASSGCSCAVAGGGGRGGQAQSSAWLGFGCALFLTLCLRRLVPRRPS